MEPSAASATRTAPEPSDAPSALAWSADNCTIGRTFEVLGDRGSWLVLREVFNGIRRFSDMRERTGMSKQVLTDRLAVLVDAGILTRVPYRVPGARPRAEYRLTPKGFDLYPILVAVADWGDRYLADPQGPPVEFRHRTECGGQVHAHAVCEHGHHVGDLREVAPTLGPGARRR